MRFVLDNKHLMKEKFTRDIFAACCEHVKGTTYEYLAKPIEETPSEKAKLKSALAKWDAIFDSNWGPNAKKDS